MLGNVVRIVDFRQLYTMKKLLGIAFAIFTIFLLIDYGVLEMIDFQTRLVCRIWLLLCNSYLVYCHENW